VISNHGKKEMSRKTLNSTPSTRLKKWKKRNLWKLTKLREYQLAIHTKILCENWKTSGTYVKNKE
jgi:hypothetical protein